MKRAASCSALQEGRWCVRLPFVSPASACFFHILVTAAACLVLRGSRGTGHGVDVQKGCLFRSGGAAGCLREGFLVEVLLGFECQALA